MAASKNQAHSRRLRSGWLKPADCDAFHHANWISQDRPDPFRQSAGNHSRIHAAKAWNPDLCRKKQVQSRTDPPSSKNLPKLPWNISDSRSAPQCKIVFPAFCDTWKRPDLFLLIWRNKAICRASRPGALHFRNQSDWWSAWFSVHQRPEAQTASGLSISTSAWAEKSVPQPSTRWTRQTRLFEQETASIQAHDGDCWSLAYSKFRPACKARKSPQKSRCLQPSYRWNIASACDKARFLTGKPKSLRIPKKSPD